MSTDYKPTSSSSDEQVMQELRQVNANLVLLHGVMQAISAQIEMALDDGEDEQREVLRTL